MELSALQLFLVAMLTLFSSVSEVNAGRLNITFEHDGGDATLNCTVRGRKRVIWRRMTDPFPISVGTTKFSTDRKYRVKKIGKVWQLQIRDLQYSDAGEYECRLTGKKDVADTLNLIVRSNFKRPHFDKTQTTIFTRVGSDVVLPCRVNNLRKHLVMWTKDQMGGRKVLSVKKKIHSGDKRHRVPYDRSNKTQWDLHIRRVQADDFGVYMCVVNTDPHLTRMVDLVEGDPDKQPEGEGGAGGDKLPEVGQSLGGRPTLVQETFREHVEVTQYKSETLTCQFRGDPAPTIHWERRSWNSYGEKIVEDLKTIGEMYTLTNAQPQDAGMYVCKASNGNPPPANARIKVKVKEVITTTTPEPTTTPFDPIGDAAARAYVDQAMMYQSRGRVAELECKAIGVPRPIVRWQFNRSPIQPSYKYEIDNRNRRHHTVISTLYVRSLSLGDFGQYTCYVTNTGGVDEATIVLAETIRG